MSLNKKRKETKRRLHDLRRQFDDDSSNHQSDLDFLQDSQPIDNEIQCHHSTDYLLEVLRDMFPGSDPNTLQRVWDRHKPDLDAAVCQLTQEIDSPFSPQSTTTITTGQLLLTIEQQEDVEMDCYEDSCWEAFDDIWQQQTGMFRKQFGADSSQQHLSREVF